MEKHKATLSGVLNAVSLILLPEKAREQDPYLFTLIVTNPLMDLSVAYVYQSHLITHQNLLDWGVAEDDFKKQAAASAAKTNPAVFERITDRLGIKAESSDAPLWVLETKSRKLGAAAIAYPDVLSAIANRFNASFFLVPCSIHSWILIPELNGININVSDLEKMVKDTNKTKVEPAERLSDHVYFYNKTSGTFQVCHAETVA